MTEGVMSAIVPVDIQQWCFRLSALNSPHELVNCETDQIIPQPSLQDDPGQATQVVQYSINTSELPDGDYVMSLELVDWANNSVVETWPMALDTTIPIVEWSINPGTEASFFDHTTLCP